MKHITFIVNGLPKHVFLSQIGFVEAAPGHPDKTRVYVQGVPLLVSGTPDVVLAHIKEAYPQEEGPPLTPEDVVAVFKNSTSGKPRRAKKGSENA